MKNEINFGYFIQNEIGSDPIKWIILAEDDDGVLILSKDCIACRLYHDKSDEKGEITWETSAIRQWLNTDFYNNAFTSEERERIVADLQSGDKIFLLNANQVKEYLPNEKERKAKPTKQAKNGVETYTKRGYCSWFLRDPSEQFLGNYTSVDTDGIINLLGGDFIMSGEQGIRPALWLKTK